jgi:2-polyprenyl-3-methyl-5-hydroxy-6-metoxy-1,4-benzoquinol methylase
VKEDLLTVAVDRVFSVDPKLGKRIRSFVRSSDAPYRERAEEFFGRYRNFIESQGKTFEFGVDCFLRLQRSMNQLRDEFLETGKYANTSFAEVERSVYSNPEVMQYHMHGLVFAQFLWPDQYHRFQFFSDNLPRYAPKIQKYLEVGGGHALYLTEGARQLRTASIQVVDISETSLAMAREIARDESRIQYQLMNIFDFPDGEYDFITMGEVLEHVENPRELLDRIRRLLAPGGRAYITTPANAPMLDHIYLFNNAEEIRAMLAECGLRIEHETKQYASGSDFSEEEAERMKFPLMFAAFVAAA